MATSYSLILSGTSQPRAIAARAFADGDRPASFDETGPALTADLHATSGFWLTIGQGTRGYFEAEAGSQPWTWEPESYVIVGFRLDGDFPRETALANMLATVARLLDSGREDAALTFNSDHLLLRREAGTTRLFPGGFWDGFKPEEIPPSLRSLLPRSARR
jgi:hypothetical protein